jgi:hypothetical protein
MTDNRELAAVFGVLAVAWILLAHTIGWYAQVAASGYVIISNELWIAFVTTVPILIFTPAVMSKARWTAPGAVIVGVIGIITSILGLTTTPMNLVYGPAVWFVLTLLFTYFSFRAYRQK